jgi:hypothetical protein
VKLLETGYKSGLNETKSETVLEEGERIVGIKSNVATSNGDGWADHNDFQFVIGRLE